MQKKISQREAYAQNRELYYKRALDLYAHGKTVREIALVIPVSKSTIQRWIDENVSKEDRELPKGIVIPRTPKAVAKMIISMNERISRLEAELELEKRKTALVDRIIDSWREYESLNSEKE